MKLPLRDARKFLQLKINSAGSFADGKWDGLQGSYKGVSGDKILFCSSSSGIIPVPYFIVDPVCPTKKYQPVHCLAEGKSLGKVFVVEEYGPQECQVRPLRGSASLRPIATADLAVIG